MQNRILMIKTVPVGTVFLFEDWSGTVENPWKRTDLAIESDFQDNIKGVRYEQKSFTGYDIIVTKVMIEDEYGEKALQRKKGTYVTIESKWLKENHLKAHEEMMKRLIIELKEFIHNYSNETVLIAGLGNRQVTADALGPAVVDRLLVSRHMTELAPEDLQGKIGSLCAVAPGVMGQTGIETKDILQGIIEQVRPQLLIVIDALSTANVERMNTTIQITDAGISPGAGMGNYRMMLSEETLGIPVLSIGIPTVIDAATLVSDALSVVGIQQAEQLEPRLMLMAESLYVTPKDMDIVLKRTANLLAGALNRVLHRMTPEEIQEYLY